MFRQITKCFFDKSICHICVIQGHIFCDFFDQFQLVLKKVLLGWNQYKWQFNWTFATSTTSLIIYKSTIPIEKSDHSNIIGLKYLREPNQILNPSSGLSTCLRFNYERLYSYVFYYGQSKDVSLQFDVRWDLLKNHVGQGNLVYVQNGKTVFHIPWFGYSNTSTLSVNIWNHICISFNIKSRNVTLVVVKYLIF